MCGAWRVWCHRHESCWFGDTNFLRQKNSGILWYNMAMLFHALPLKNYTCCDNFAARTSQKGSCHDAIYLQIHSLLCNDPVSCTYTSTRTFLMILSRNLRPAREGKYRLSVFGHDKIILRPMGLHIIPCLENFTTREWHLKVPGKTAFAFNLMSYNLTHARITSDSIRVLSGRGWYPKWNTF